MHPLKETYALHEQLHCHQFDLAIDGTENLKVCECGKVKVAMSEGEIEIQEGDTIEIKKAKYNQILDSFKAEVIERMRHLYEWKVVGGTVVRVDKPPTPETTPWGISIGGDYDKYYVGDTDSGYAGGGSGGSSWTTTTSTSIPTNMNYDDAIDPTYEKDQTEPGLLSKLIGKVTGKAG